LNEKSSSVLDDTSPPPCWQKRY